MNGINAISQQAVVPQQLMQAAGNGAPSESFKNMLMDGLNQVNQMQQDADHAVETIFTGGDTSVAEVLTAVQKADMSFKLMLQVRNKMMQAYQEIKDIRI
ncbi:MAG: flagellar hook-basal body complex protein FliE [Blastopirellula sp.]|nr:MAG: flagellar hook-basal body complex protein FliE [Blastopirellula sp.]